MSTRHRGGAVACLITVLCVTAGCVAAQQQFVDTTRSELWCFVEHAVWTDLQPLVDKLKSQIDALDRRVVRLDSRVDALNSRLDQLEGKGGPGGSQPLASDCSELSAGARSAINLLQPGLDRSLPPVQAYCDLVTDGGKWTVIQRRQDKEPRQNFNLGWVDYKEGFGELEGEFWWGLDNLWRTTSARGRQYELRINLEDLRGEKRQEVYKNFRISSEEDGYQLSVGTYSGNSGDSLRASVGHKFSTMDRDQDGSEGSNCAARYMGAWWYSNCGYSNLNGPYKTLKNDNDTRFDGILWFHFSNYVYTMKKVEMKIRRI